MPQASPIILRLWAALLLLTAVVGGPIPIFTFGVVGFATLSVFWLKEESGAGFRAEHRVHGFMLLLCTVWFAFNLALELRVLFGATDVNYLRAMTLALAFLFPPMILHSYYAEAVQTGLRPGWRPLLPASYVIGLAASVTSASRSPAASPVTIAILIRSSFRCLRTASLTSSTVSSSSTFRKRARCPSPSIP